MKATRGTLLVLAAGMVACIALGWLLRSSRLRGESLRAELAVPTPPQPSAQATTTSSASVAAAETNQAAATTEHRELAERTALLEAARRVPEVARREAALRVIKQIQAAHAATPPAPRPVPPPEPRDAQYFAELLDDPEYLQLVSQQWRLQQGEHTDRRLQKLDVAEAVRQKIVELEFDSYTASLDVQRYMRDAAADRSAAIDASRKLRAENDAAIKQLLGEQAYAEYRSPDPARVALPNIPYDGLEPLATRLSYSSLPLDPPTRQRLVDLQQSMAGSVPAYTLPSRPEFIERARSVLQPGQIAALEELRAEYEARQARHRLPKSSELPRTTRRERLEATTR